MPSAAPRLTPRKRRARSFPNITREYASPPTVQGSMMKFLQNLDTASKLLGAFALVLGLTVLLGVCALGRMADIDRASAALSGKWLPDIIAAQALKHDLQELRTWQTQHILSTDKEGIDNLDKKLTDAMTAYRANVAQSATTLTDA